MTPNISSGNIEYIDGFEDYNTSQAGRYWTFTSGGFSIQSTTKRNGSNALNTSSNGVLQITLTNQVTRTVGAAVQGAGSVNGSAFITFLDNATIQCDLRWNTNGTLSVTRNGTVLGTSTFALNLGIWYYIEMTLTVDPSTGSYDVHVNGNSILSGSGVNTRASSNSYSNVIKLSTVSSTGAIFDDLYIRKDSTFMGDQTVLVDLPNGAGGVTNWTPLTSSNYVEVQDNPADDDTSYNSTGSTSQIDVFAFPNLSISTGTVGAVLISDILRTDASGVATACIMTRRSSTNYSGGTQYIGSTSYNAYMDISINDPSTSAAWTITNLNAAQFGYQRLT